MAIQLSRTSVKELNPPVLKSLKKQLFGIKLVTAIYETLQNETELRHIKSTLNAEFRQGIQESSP